MTDHYLWYFLSLGNTRPNYFSLSILAVEYRRNGVLYKLFVISLFGCVPNWRWMVGMNDWMNVLLVYMLLCTKSCCSIHGDRIRSADDYHSLKKMRKICWYHSLSNLKTVTSGMQDLFIEDFNYILLNKTISFSSLTLVKGEAENILKENSVSSFLQIIRIIFS